MRETRAQVSVDFLIGILVFAGILFFAFQFVGSTAAPFTTSQTTDEKVTKVHNVGDRLYHDKLSTEREGKLNLSYFDDNGDLKTEEQLAIELGLVTGTTDPDEVQNITDRYRLSVEVFDTDGGTVSLNGDDIRIPADKPDRRGGVARAERVGYTEEYGTVVIELEVW